VIVRVPGTQMVIELMSLNSTLLARRVAAEKVDAAAGETAAARKRVHAFAPHERRASPSALKRAISASASNVLTVISVSRAASNISALDAFYVDGMECSTTLSVDASGYSKRCYLWDTAGATADVCFTKRPPSATSGSFKVSDFETMLNTVHSNAVTDDCSNKWVDNHYAVDGRSKSADYIVDYIESSGAYYYCSGTQVHYIIDPTGFGIQLDLSFSGSASVCTSSAARTVAPFVPSFVESTDNFCPCTAANAVCGGTGL